MRFPEAHEAIGLGNGNGRSNTKAARRTRGVGPTNSHQQHRVMAIGRAPRARTAIEGPARRSAWTTGSPVTSRPLRPEPDHRKGDEAARRRRAQASAISGRSRAGTRPVRCISPGRTARSTLRLRGMRPSARAIWTSWVNEPSRSAQGSERCDASVPARSSSCSGAPVPSSQMKVCRASVGSSGRGWPALSRKLAAGGRLDLLHTRSRVGHRRRGRGEWNVPRGRGRSASVAWRHYSHSGYSAGGHIPPGPFEYPLTPTVDLARSGAYTGRVRPSDESETPITCRQK